jgi:hypothetical protein
MKYRQIMLGNQLQVMLAMCIHALVMIYAVRSSAGLGDARWDAYDSLATGEIANTAC